MVCFELDKLTHDALLSEKNDLILIRGVEALAQWLKVKLLTIQGEWFRNTDDGVPYYELVLIKDPDMKAIEQMIRAQLLEEDEVTEVYDILLSVFKRKLTAVISCGSIHGDLTVKL